MPTMEKAKLCPRCGHPGTPTGIQPGEDRSKVHTFRCDNERCQWNGTGFIVQVLSDGTIPERQPGPKQFDLMQVPGVAQMGRDILRRTVAEDPELAAFLEDKGL